MAKALSTDERIALSMAKLRARGQAEQVLKAAGKNADFIREAEKRGLRERRR